VFDFDGTILDGASPVRLIRKLVALKLMPVGVSLKAGVWGLRYKLGEELDQSTPRSYVFKSLTQHSVEEVDKIMVDLYYDELEPRLYPQALARIAQHKAAGEQVVIVSASFVPIVREIAKRVGADGIIATVMEVACGSYTGKVVGEPPEGVQKLAQLTTWANERYGSGNWAVDWAYGDHSSDEPILAAATHAVAVNPNRGLARTARQNNWEVVNW
jgi:HAD superfamily hydrolase (TIGR01490 family)